MLTRVLTAFHGRSSCAGGSVRSRNYLTLDPTCSLLLVCSMQPSSAAQTRSPCCVMMCWRATTGAATAEHAPSNTQRYSLAKLVRSWPIDTSASTTTHFLLWLPTLKGSKTKLLAGSGPERPSTSPCSARLRAAVSFDSSQGGQSLWLYCTVLTKAMNSVVRSLSCAQALRWHVLAANLSSSDFMAARSAAARLPVPCCCCEEGPCSRLVLRADMVFRQADPVAAAAGTAQRCSQHTALSTACQGEQSSEPVSLPYNQGSRGHAGPMQHIKCARSSIQLARAAAADLFCQLRWIL